MKAIGQVEPVEDVVRGAEIERRVGGALLRTRQAARAQGHDALEVLEVRAGEELLADGLERRPVLQVRVERRRAHEGRPRLGPLREAPREVQEGVARVGARLEPLERQAEVEHVLRRARARRVGREEETVRVGRVLPALLEEGALASRLELRLGRHVVGRDDAGLRVDVRRRTRDARWTRRAPARKPAHRRGNGPAPPRPPRSH